MTVLTKNCSISLLNKVIINLQGDFSAELGSELYLKSKSLLSVPHLVLLDGSGLLSLDPIGWEYLKKLLQMGKERNCFFSVCHLPFSVREDWQKTLGRDIPIFEEREKAIEYLEGVYQKSENASHSKPSPSGDTNSSDKARMENESQPNNPVLKSETHLTECPYCGMEQKLSTGLKVCTHCGGKFFVHRNNHLSLYERLV